MPGSILSAANEIAHVSSGSLLKEELKSLLGGGESEAEADPTPASLRHCSGLFNLKPLGGTNTLQLSQVPSSSVIATLT